MSFQQSHAQVLIALVAAANSLSLDASKLVVGSPTAYEGEDGNTQFVLSAAPDQEAYTGEVTITYNRLDLTTLFEGIGISELTVGNADATDVVGLIPSIIATYGLDLVEADVINDTLVRDEGGIAILELSAADASLFYTGSIPLTVDLPDPLTDLEDILQTTVLDGLHYPLGDTSALTPPAVEENQPLAAEETKEDGTLQVGTGNPSTGYVTASNSELVLALAARMYQGPAVEPENGTYSLSVEDNQDWNFTYSIAYKQSSESNHPISDLYNVYLEVKSLDHDEVILFRVDETQEGYQFTGLSNQGDIVDDYVSPTGTVIQNIQRTKFYAEQFLGAAASANSAGSLTGNWEINLVAQRKNSVAPLLRNTIVVVAEPVAAPT